MERALEFVRSIASISGADIHIYTDSLDRAAFAEGDQEIAWTIHGSEDALVNVSINKFGAVKTPQGTEAIVKITNASDANQTGDIQLVDLLTGKVLLEEKFTVEAGKDALLSFKELPDSQALQAEMIVDDDYAADNTAAILLGADVSEAVVDGQLHELVKRAFEAVGLAVSTGSSKELIAAQDNAISVTNDVSLLNKGSKPVVIIGRNDKSSTPVSGAVQSIADPLFTIADISDVYVSALYPPFTSYTTIATVGDQPFIQRSKRGDIVVLADIELTDWPLHPSFPLFVWSAAEQLRSDTDTLGLFVPNERKAVLSAGKADGLEVFTLKDDYVTTFADGSSFVAPTRPGIYKVRDGGAEKLFAVQLEQDEKELIVGASYKIGQTAAIEEAEEGMQMIGWLFIIPLLLLLLIEWEVQRRRGYPN